VRAFRRAARQAGLLLLVCGAAVAGLASGVVFAYLGDLPQISALDDYTPSTITRVYDRDGQLLGEFATERRVVIDYDDIPEVLRQAIIAAEDAGFNSHVGLSISRIIVTLIRDVLEGRLAGASTLTQQLARNLFPIGFEKTLERKIKEALLAIQIEKRYTKREILTLYCNHVHFGHGTYGVEAASQLYFGKSARHVTLEEAALLAGIIQSPARQSPFVDKERARQRRNYVLDRMAEEGYITRQQAEAAKARPVVVVDRRKREDLLAPHFVEEVRKHLETKYGAKALYQSGLSVHTTLDARLQRIAERAVAEGLRRVDKRRGYRGPLAHFEGDLERVDEARWHRPLDVGAIVPAVVTAVAPGRIDVRVGALRGQIDGEAFRWAGRDATRLVRPGDLIEVRLLAVDQVARRLRGALEQEPQIEGALVAIENRTGQILAMVGGYSFERSKFNRATQAYRQLGSLFKVIVYTAAIDRGYTPTTILLDLPVSYPAGPGQPPYTPQNYDGTFEGPITLRHALEKSRNIPAVRTMAQIGPEQVALYARRFGFDRPLPPYLSVALGAAEWTLLGITSAYSAFPNQGVRMTPYFIAAVRDRDGNLLEENRPRPQETIGADTAYVMTSLLEGVIDRGTAARAASIPWPLAGKTGTVDDFTDAWFVGFDPAITVGVWVGYDQKRTIYYGADGAGVALPIWMEFMKGYIDLVGRPGEFAPPGNIVFLTVDSRTGRPTSPAAPGSLREAFVAGTQPGSVFEP
jgi:penicillin-binding protein 1A